MASLGEKFLKIHLRFRGLGLSPTSSKTSGRKLQNFNLGTHLPCLQNCERIENRNVLQARVLRECVYTRPACKECERLKRNDLQAGLARVDIHLPCLLSEYYIQNKRAGTRWFTSGFGSYIYFRYVSAKRGNACNFLFFRIFVYPVFTVIIINIVNQTLNKYLGFRFVGVPYH